MSKNCELERSIGEVTRSRFANLIREVSAGNFEPVIVSFKERPYLIEPFELLDEDRNVIPVEELNDSILVDFYVQRTEILEGMNVRI